MTAHADAAYRLLAEQLSALDALIGQANSRRGRCLLAARRRHVLALMHEMERAA